MSALPQFSMRQLLDAGVHFGHQTMRWNPKMAPYIYGVRNNVHILDLRQTVPMLHRALETACNIAAKNGRVLFVGTKHQASPIIAETAKRCGQYYMNHRWLGGTLTNWDTVSESIKTLRSLEAKLNDKELNYSKKERLELERQLNKLNMSLGGIKDMGGLPDLLFVIDTNKEKIAIAEAKKLGIPVIAVVDSNSDPENINYIIPGNDDATRSIHLYCSLVSDAILAGIQQAVTSSTKDKDDEERRDRGRRGRKETDKSAAKEDSSEKDEGENNSRKNNKTGGKRKAEVVKKKSKKEEAKEGKKAEEEAAE